MSNKIIHGTTCFEEHRKRGLTCQKKSCRNWMQSSDNLNCAIIATTKTRESKSMTLQEIGDIFGVTRMRICQIEKAAIKKLKDRIAANHS